MPASPEARPRRHRCWQQRLFRRVSRQDRLGVPDAGGRGEVDQVTSIIHEGRAKAAAWSGWCTKPRAAAGVRMHGGFARANWSSTRGTWSSSPSGSSVHKGGVRGGRAEKLEFPAAPDGQELYCQMDAGFRPLKFAFGNVAYSIGDWRGGSLGALLRRLTRERGCRVLQHFSIRHATWRLQRICADARRGGKLGGGDQDLHHSVSRHAGDGDDRHGLAPRCADCGRQAGPGAAGMPTMGGPMPVTSDLT